MSQVSNAKCMKKGACLILISILLLVMAGCGSDSKQKKTAFPTDKDGWPKDNVALINGKEYPLKKIENSSHGQLARYEIRLKLDKKDQKKAGNEDNIDVDDMLESIEVTLPVRSEICNWSIDPKEMQYYERNTLPIKTKETLEGGTSDIQTFRYLAPRDGSHSVWFKWSNVNEMEKAFSDQQEYYLLTITTYQ